MEHAHDSPSDDPGLRRRSHRHGNREPVDVLEILDKLDLAYEERWRLAYRSLCAP